MDAQHDARKLSDLNFRELNRLARALFEEQERMLPEGETWGDLDQGDLAYFRNSALAVVKALEKLRSR